MKVNISMDLTVEQAFSILLQALKVELDDEPPKFEVEDGEIVYDNDIMDIVMSSLIYLRAIETLNKPRLSNFFSQFLSNYRHLTDIINTRLRNKPFKRYFQHILNINQRNLSHVLINLNSVSQFRRTSHIKTKYLITINR